MYFSEFLLFATKHFCLYVIRSYVEFKLFHLSHLLFLLRLFSSWWNKNTHQGIKIVLIFFWKDEIILGWCEKRLGVTKTGTWNGENIIKTEGWRHIWWIYGMNVFFQSSGNKIRLKNYQSTRCAKNSKRLKESYAR